MSRPQPPVVEDVVYDPSVYSLELPRPTAVTPARRVEQQREALDMVRMVRELHRGVPGKSVTGRVCAHSGDTYPCATIRALTPAAPVVSR